MSQNFLNNTIKSPYDPRDWVAESIYPSLNSSQRNLVNLPEKLDLRDKLLQPRSQGSRGTCASFASSAMKEYQEKINIDYKSYLSPEFVYFHRENKPSGGMHLRDVCKILQKQGIATEYDFPYLSEDATEVPQKVLDDAKNLKIKSYALVNTIEGLKTALSVNGVCIISFPTYEGGEIFYKPKNNGDKRTGGHALAVVGYDKNGFIIRNSWGNTWKDKGHFVFPYTEFGLQWEIWTTIDDSSYKIPEPRQLIFKKLLDALKACFTHN